MSIEQLFPEVKKYYQKSISTADFSELPYFSRYTGLISQKQCKSKADKSYKHFKLIKVKSGTILYSCEDIAQHGFVLLNGSVQLLKKKSSRQKTQTFAGHILHNEQDKQIFLLNNYKIPKQKSVSITRKFYEEGIVFKYLPHQTLINQQDFGFGQMNRNCSRTHCAICTSDSQLLVIEKIDFDLVLHDFHVKKQTAIIKKLLVGCKSQLIDQMLPKMLPVLNTGLLLNYSNQDIVYNENTLPSEVFFILSGEVEVRKKTILTIPKKYMKHEIQDPVSKQITFKICKYSTNQILGEEEVFTGKFSRFYTVTSTLNNTLIFKLDQNVFLKCISDFVQYEQMLMENSVQKKSMLDNVYNRQYNKAQKVFTTQYENFDNKKKEKLLANFMNDGAEKNAMFEAYSPEGVFFRDTFQRLEGFDQDQKSPHKSQSIKRFKKKNQSVEQKQTLKLQVLDENSVTQKMLFSPKKKVNMAEFYSESITPSLLEVSNSKIQKPQRPLEKISIKKCRVIGKFQEIQRDEEIYKRVLIKNGMYPKDRRTNKSNSVKALVHHNFDEVIEQCITRKNQAIKRTNKDKKNQIIVETFHRSVQNLKSKAYSTHNWNFPVDKMGNVCKGVDQFRKKVQSIHNLGSSGRFGELEHSRKKSIASRIEDCIGINEKPKSSQISHRKSILMQRFGSVRSPEKIVLLNHMMKPMTYFNSTEL